MNQTKDSFFLDPPKQGTENFNQWLEEFNAKKSMSHLSLADLIGQYRQVKNSLRDLEIQEKCLRDALTMRFHEEPLDKYGLKVELVTRKGSIQYSLIPQLKDLDLEQFRNEPTEYYKISEMKNEKE